MHETYREVCILTITMNESRTNQNTEELEIISREIRQKFKDLIADWKSVINLKVHKFEEYNI